MDAKQLKKPIWSDWIFASWLAVAWAASASSSTAAETVQVPNRVAAASEGMTRPYTHPMIDDAVALRGAALLSALRQGGLVLFMRHTQTGTVTAQCNMLNLSTAGERDARFVGDSIRKLRVPIGRVLSSPVCRVSDTARLLGLGEPELTSDLSNIPVPPDADLGAARARRLSEMPARATNTLMVSHMQSGKSQDQWLHLDFGEIIVFRPDAKGQSIALARIRADDWYDLMAIEQK